MNKYLTDEYSLSYNLTYNCFGGEAMGQVTIYIDDKIQTKIKQMAKSMNLSVSKYITRILEQKTSTEWDDGIKQLNGAWQDFPSIEEIRTSKDVLDAKRESF